MAAGFPEDSFNIFTADENGLRGLVDGRRDWIERNGHHFGVVHADPRSPGLDSGITSFVAATNGFLVGGLTSGSRFLSADRRWSNRGAVFGAFCFRAI